jgi:hypothetical protein
MSAAALGDATTTVGADVKRAWLTDIDIRAGVAPPTTTVPRTPEAAGGLETGGDDTGGDDTGGDDTGGALASGPLGTGLDAGGDPGRDGGRLNACGLLTPATALDPASD